MVKHLSILVIVLATILSPGCRAEGSDEPRNGALAALEAKVEVWQERKTTDQESIAAISGAIASFRASDGVAAFGNSDYLELLFKILDKAGSEETFEGLVMYDIARRAICEFVVVNAYFRLDMEAAQKALNKLSEFKLSPVKAALLVDEKFRPAGKTELDYKGLIDGVVKSAGLGDPKDLWLALSVSRQSTGSILKNHDNPALLMRLMLTEVLIDVCARPFVLFVQRKGDIKRLLADDASHFSSIIPLDERKTFAFVPLGIAKTSCVHVANMLNGIDSSKTAGFMSGVLLVTEEQTKPHRDELAARRADAEVRKAAILAYQLAASLLSEREKEALKAQALSMDSELSYAERLRDISQQYVEALHGDGWKKLAIQARKDFDDASRKAVDLEKKLPANVVEPIAAEAYRRNDLTDLGRMKLIIERYHAAIDAQGD